MSTQLETVTLASSRVLPARKANGGTLAIQMLSLNLSGDTTFTVDISVDGVSYDTATANGSDISDTLKANETKVVALEMVAGIWYKVTFAGVTTGTIACYVMD
jgi:hypothetical protein